MNADVQRILVSLQSVAAQRRLRADDRVLGEWVQGLKTWQHARFGRSYVDLLASERYRSAARFFLDDLYGPRDFTSRDGQFARVVPSLVRLFPREVVQTVTALGDLHCLSEELDSAMATRIRSTEVDAARYGAAWRAVGRADDRERQIGLIMRVGAALERYTRSALLWHSLRVLRGPARAAGLGALQDFLETGFRTFRGMHGAAHFLDLVARRERFMAARLFSGADLDGSECCVAIPSGELP